MKKALFNLVLLALMVAPSERAAAQRSVTGEVAVEVRGFVQNAAFAKQDDYAASLRLQPEFYRDWARGSHRIVLEPFVRLDAADASRSHVDLRHAYWEWIGSRFELRSGFSRVFWGVTESQHLVDIINQTDTVENPDGEEKLGQPMIRGSWIGDRFTVEAFILPAFRERTFPGSSGRLRTPVPIQFDEGLQTDRVGFAARISGYAGLFDGAVSFFRGTSRDPLFDVDLSSGGFKTLYPVITQVGIEGQWTQGPWLFKLESIYRSGYESDFLAAVAGFEYTFSSAGLGGIDLSVLGEYHRDDRDTIPVGNVSFETTPFDDDVFAGVRVALNDVQSTQLLGGAVVDRLSGETAVFVEFERRVGTSFLAGIEVRSFHKTKSNGPLSFFRQDGFVQVGVGYFF